ncbi:DNA-binding transcriptional regulator Fis [Methylonatrum kenyense]|nr:DNA-binding transcriptional regulator Fis [Methylonatrum kenyense]MCK8516145.1 DNA-binding transcriptional regulator Fis [Methylonatrum kenyense]
MTEQSSAQKKETVCGKDADSDTNVGAIRACVADSLETYLHQLNGHDCANLHSLVLAEVEPPLLATVLAHCNGNQTKAAQLLGLNRGTLRKKLVQYGIDH